MLTTTIKSSFIFEGITVQLHGKIQYNTLNEEEVDGDKNGFFHIIFNRMNASNKNIMKMKDRYIGELELLRSSKTPASILCVCVCVLKSSPCHRNTN